MIAAVISGLLTVLLTAGAALAPEAPAPNAPLVEDGE